METKALRKLRTSDIAILLWNVFEAARLKEVGFVDAEHSLRSLTDKLDHEVDVPEDVLESALWSANMLSESRRFRHPTKKGFKQFVQSLCKNEEEYHEVYNYFKEKSDGKVRRS